MNIFLSLMLAAASSVSAAPDWIDGKSGSYSRDRYLIGVGFGDDRASAEDRARASISRIFSTLVTAHTDVVETERNIKAGDKTDSTFSQMVSENVHTASKQLLEGVDIVENWHDPKESRHYALAALERAKAMTSLREKIAGFDGQAREWQKNMKEASERFPRVKAALKLKALLNARGELNSQLRVLHPEGRGEAPVINDAEARPQIAAAIAALNILVDCSGSESRIVETGIVRSLNTLGLEARRGRSSEPADIIVMGDIETSRLEPKDGRWRWARSSVTVHLKDGRSGKIFLQFDASSRQASADYKEAVRRSLMKLSQKSAREVSAGISSYFENQ